jgi:hypothetical protein
MAGAVGCTAADDMTAPRRSSLLGTRTTRGLRSAHDGSGRECAGEMQEAGQEIWEWCVRAKVEKQARLRVGGAEGVGERASMEVVRVVRVVMRRSEGVGLGG